MPPVRTSTRQAARRNRAPAARGSVRDRPASRSGPRTSTTLRAADGIPDLAALEPGTSSGRLRTSVAATSSPPGPTDPGLIALLTEIQTSNQAMIQRLDALDRRTAQQGPQEAVNAAVDQVLQSLTGTLAPNPTVPVDIHVPDKIHQKILQDEFVDFAIQLQRQKGDMVYILAVDSQSGQPNLVLAPQSKKTKLPFTRWVEA